MSVTSASLRFAGYAALFDVPDAANDTIKPGAFAKTLNLRRGPIPIYWQHRPEQAIGAVEAIAEDGRGLRVIGRIDNPNGRAAHALVRREIDGLSFGYRAREALRDSKGRNLLEIDLFEVSIVTHPLQHGARVHLLA